MSYKISGPDEYLAITGMSIRTVKITKASWVWPLQRCTRFSVQPRDYAMDLQAMTKEKLQFALPVVFTVGPDVNDRGANSNSEDASAVDREDRGDALVKFAMLLAQSEGSNKKDHGDHVASIVKGIIEGETRVLVSSMTMEEIFTEREVFKKRIFRNIQSELDQFGLKIYNSNVKELKDAPGSVYFESLSRKAHEGATNQARIDVAEAQLRGNVGEAKRRGEQDREIAKINADTAVQKTERDIERAKAEAHLNKEQTLLTRDVDIARVEAQRTLESKDEDLKRQVEIKRAAAEVERLRAKDVVKATITRESKQQAADAAAYEVTANARANQEAKQRLADADAYKTRIDAEADNYAAQQSADASVFRQLKEAEGISAMADAYAKLANAFGGPAGLIQYMMIEKGTYVELAKANAEAIRGLQPKISVWNTGSNAGGEAGGDPTTAMRNVYQMLPPLMTTINEQTGITLPEWQFGKMNAGMQAMNQSNVNGEKSSK
ncbi:flotillin domain-containing protein [Pochonia chlamydosporia 170]|uniref:Flotillin domain-containing protein n=1 Tax=Pochonia chlamydosporia 170 TaxID=1380566 RepID=A0A179FWS3_METCM|nr:flotillin domain-containing protein [Pochonia chlamydosporia 170]OAQ69807.1 flotillin domain-containing protein [Pochonia chlamydosporia 170]